TSHRLGHRRFQLDQDQAPYAAALSALAARDSTKLMVPGHGGTDAGISELLTDFIGEKAIHLDVPMLLEGIDLEDDSPFAESLALAADAWGARRTWFPPTAPPRPTAPSRSPSPASVRTSSPSAAPIRASATASYSPASTPATS